MVKVQKNYTLNNQCKKLATALTNWEIFKSNASGREVWAFRTKNGLFVPEDSVNFAMGLGGHFSPKPTMQILKGFIATFANSMKGKKNIIDLNIRPSCSDVLDFSHKNDGAFYKVAFKDGDYYFEQTKDNGSSACGCKECRQKRND